VIRANLERVSATTLLLFTYAVNSNTFAGHGENFLSPRPTSLAF